MKNKKGFTIVELVIVIAIIAILAAVLVPTFSNIIKKANESASLQEAKSNFNEIYALDYADGVLDGKQGETSLLKDADNSDYSVIGYDGCTYEPNKEFVYKNGKYKCTTTMTMTGYTNEWTVEDAE